MEQFIIEGGHPLNGEVQPSGNKNAALPLLAASLLTDEPLTLHNVPRIGDIETQLELLADLGVDIAWRDPHTVTLRARNLRHTTPNPALFQRTRGSVTLIGPMLARAGRVHLPSPGGDKIGRRRIDTHLLALEELGAEIDHNGNFTVRASGLRGADILLDEASVTATENAVMAAALTPGVTIIRNAASEPHVQDLCHCINQMGGRISGIGSNILTVEGVPRLHGGEFTISPDHIEIGSFIGLGAVTRGTLRIKGVNCEHLRMMEMVFRRRLGVKLHYEGDTLVVEDGQELQITPDVGGAVPKIENAPWPAFPADVLSIALVVATQARGTVLIHDKMFESRLYFTDKLITMGAQIILCDPHRCVVVGPSQLHGSTVVSPDIRAGMALVIAALCAKGVSEIGNIGQIDRGYERLEEKLLALGAHIRRVRP
ncbi:MAG: UDP-N-acetylglucosamine 1-carboxyvinyltransferase [Caldilineales bacterium]|nr:UDP-N-acetylglucosamine 1-carboxyvinyltransferase [Caldilineales bacterium]MDW8318982.1 UDP-N-acetylglucosamine 1-carboxyvinyltransferase [Anaerolineae bacterium]